MIARYLFRDGVLIATGNTFKTFDAVSKSGDFMLVDNSFTCPPVWRSYRMCFYENPTCKWAWAVQADSVTQELQVLLLLQKSSELLNTSQTIY